jgi:brefeldin A-resistance guanine nucleotide exchange factor 1
LQVARQVAFGMYEMLRNNAANIHETSDWEVVFAVIEIVGAGASPDDQVQHLHLQNHD